MLNKEKILMMLDNKIKYIQEENDYDNNLSDECIGKRQFVAASSRALRELREIRAFIECGLGDDD